MKRVFDVVVAVAALAVLFPLLVIIAIASCSVMGHPVLFRQQRPGRNGVPFTILKFRTMRNEKGADGRALPDSERITRIGLFLRRTSLDELPELINVLNGDMSLVGPRPLLMEYCRCIPRNRRGGTRFGQASPAGRK